MKASEEFYLRKYSKRDGRGKSALIRILRDYIIRQEGDGGAHCLARDSIPEDWEEHIRLGLQGPVPY